MKSFSLHTSLALAFSCLVGGPAACSRCEADGSSPPPPPASVADSNGIYSITLPHFEPVMPAGPGRGSFEVVCVSCHSPGYVLMQPPFSRATWQGIAEKMIKIYGAHADTNQIQEIASYLACINGNTPHPEAEDDDAMTSLDAAPAPAAAPAPLLVAAQPEAVARRGASLFQQDCAGCHGNAGRGHGWASQALLPKPSNLASARFSIELLSQTLWDGVPGTSMPSWRDLPRDDLQALASYVLTLHAGARPETVASENPARGRALFLQSCAPCHGPLGDGKTTAAAKLAPAPTNLQLEQPDLDQVLAVLRDGIPGTSMPVWKSQYSETDRMALADYVRTLFMPPPAQRPP